MGQNDPGLLKPLSLVSCLRLMTSWFKLMLVTFIFVWSYNIIHRKS